MPIKLMNDNQAAQYISQLAKEHNLDESQLLEHYESYIYKVGLISGFAEYLHNEAYDVKMEANQMRVQDLQLRGKGPHNRST